MTWEVAIVGPPAVLAELQHAFPIGGDPSLVSVEGRWVLRSGRFEPVADAQAVFQEAEGIIISLSGIARLLLAAEAPLTIGGVTEVRANGTRVNYVQPATGGATLGPSIASTVATRLGGVVEEHRPSDRSPAWLRRAIADPEVARALRLRDAGDMSWTDLYRLFEIVRAAAGGEEVVRARGWATRSELDRFGHSANSVTAAGDEARHGIERTQPPRKPMTLAEARTLIDRLLERWIGEGAA
jgi:hypothetical protein